MMPDAVIAALMFLGASWGDLQERRVRNQYWMPFLVVAAILWTARPFDPWLIGGAAIMSGAMYALWWFGFFGGADAKGMMVFAWLWPGTPDLLAGHTIPALDTLVNAALAAFLFPLLFLIINALRGDVALPAMLLGVRMDLQAARARHVWPMQQVVEGRLRWRLWQRPAQGMDATYAALRRHGLQRIWTTPKIPFMLPLTAGAIVTALWGNVMLRWML